MISVTENVNTVNASETSLWTYSEDIALWSNIIPNDLIELCIHVKPKNVGDIKCLKTEHSVKGQIISRSFKESTILSLFHYG